MPGFDEKELQIEGRDHTLSVTGAREEQTETKEKKTVRLRERLEKRFERCFEVPTGIDNEHVNAEYTKGVLTVHVPKTPYEKPQRVEITNA